MASPSLHEFELTHQYFKVFITSFQGFPWAVNSSGKVIIPESFPDLEKNVCNNFWDFCFQASYSKGSYMAAPV